MFYTIRQINSGGYYIDNEYVSNFISVEANSVEEAEEKLENIVEDHLEYCSCCGRRWDIDIDEEDGDLIPMIYEEPYNNCTDTFWNRGSIIIYYSDGRKEKVKLNGGI